MSYYSKNKIFPEITYLKALTVQVNKWLTSDFSIHNGRLTWVEMQVSQAQNFIKNGPIFTEFFCIYFKFFPLSK